MNNKKFITALIIFACASICSYREAHAASYYGVYPDKTSSYTGSSYPISPIGCHATGNGVKGTYPTRKGVILVTNNGSIGSVLGHAAIVYSSGTVVEALSSGVCVGKNNWSTTKSRVSAVTVRATTPAQDSNAADYCKSKVGLNYNYNYYDMSMRRTFYCSQLVWAAYRDMYAIDLNTSAYDFGSKRAIGPFEFVRTSGKTIFPVYMKNWVKDDVTS